MICMTSWLINLFLTRMVAGVAKQTQLANNNSPFLDFVYNSLDNYVASIYKIFNFDSCF
ncbi:protein of unknown function [Candidatus Methylocalor cossyra]|uniref:Uncharacterized protein n=1 Tax=Candidatus Methylocalor cossyra TaxID=3108543 RepID=A0ABM9NJ23_9GAMM